MKNCPEISGYHDSSLGCYYDVPHIKRRAETDNQVNMTYHLVFDSVELSVQITHRGVLARVVDVNSRVSGISQRIFRELINVWGFDLVTVHQEIGDSWYTERNNLVGYPGLSNTS